MIENYTFGKITIDKKEYSSNVILINNKPKQARYLEGHILEIDDLTSLVKSKPEIIIIGTGASGTVHPSQEIKEFIKEKGIQLIIKPSKEACSTYNELIDQGKKVAAFIHNTC